MFEESLGCDAGRSYQDLDECSQSRSPGWLEVMVRDGAAGGQPNFASLVGLCAAPEAHLRAASMAALPAVAVPTDLASLLPDAMILADRQGRVLSVNRAAERLFGRPASVLRGMPIGTLVEAVCPGTLARLGADAGAATVTRLVTAAVAAGALGLALPGRRAPVRLRALAADGAIGAGWTLFLLTELSAGAQAEPGPRGEAARPTKRAGDRVETQPADGTGPDPDLLSTVSHELRTPLTALLGYSEALMAMGPAALPVATAATFLERIYKAGEHMLAIVNDLLDYSKIEAARTHLHEENINLSVLLEDSLALADGQKGAATLTLTIAGNIPDVQIHGDRLRLSQVLINVIGNAIKFTPDGGRIELAATWLPNGGLALTVSDDGRGMSESEMTLALEPFGQAALGEVAGRSKGTGLGLPLSKRLLGLHGGDLTLASRPGEGTIVTLVLPAARVSARQAEARLSVE